ncbi:ATP-binding protein [Candidatus Micrarchaeota archaeon]|nr:ATP-binding protein [Candidatus Micrarchaeota archaeon]
MLFDVAPKKARKDMYNYSEEYLTLIKAIKDEKIIVVKGVRRIGKTSLIKVAYSELKMPKAYIDVRGISPSKVSEWNTVIFRCFKKMNETIDVTKKVKKMIKGVEITGKLGFVEIGATFSIPRSEDIIEEIEELDKKLGKLGKKAVLFFDEVQITKKFGASNLFAFIYDNTNNITLVLTGSEVGILEEFAGYSSDSPLYGRAREEIDMRRLSPSQSLEFLKLGFIELHMNVPDEELLNTVESLDGIIGWLTLYGHYRRKISHKKALTRVLKEAEKITHNEIERFLRNKGPAKTRYLKILKALSKRPMSWGDIKRMLPKVTDARINNYLEQLIKYSFIEKVKKEYRLADPLISQGFKLFTIRR